MRRSMPTSLNETASLSTADAERDEPCLTRPALRSSSSPVVQKRAEERRKREKCDQTRRKGDGTCRQVQVWPRDQEAEKAVRVHLAFLVYARCVLVWYAVDVVDLIWPLGGQ